MTLTPFTLLSFCFLGFLPWMPLSAHSPPLCFFPPSPQEHICGNVLICRALAPSCQSVLSRKHKSLSRQLRIFLSFPVFVSGVCSSWLWCGENCLCHRGSVLCDKVHMGPCGSYTVVRAGEGAQRCFMAQKNKSSTFYWGSKSQVQRTWWSPFQQLRDMKHLVLSEFKTCNQRAHYQHLELSRKSLGLFIFFMYGASAHFPHRNTLVWSKSKAPNKDRPLGYCEKADYSH